MNRYLFGTFCMIVVPLVYAASTFTCSPTSNSILFGTYNPLSATNTDSTGSYVISCTDVGGNTKQSTILNYKAVLSSVALRQMAPPSGTDRINYNLYMDTTRSIVWGDGTGAAGTYFTGSISIPGGSTVTSPPLNYYGRITPGQDVSANSPGPAPTTYSQSLTITVTCTNSKAQAVAC